MGAITREIYTPQVVENGDLKSVVNYLDGIVECTKITRVYLKPNMTTAQPRKGVTTSKWLVKFTAEYFASKNLDVVIAESTTKGRPLSFAWREYSWFGLDQNRFSFIDISEEPSFKVQVQGFDPIELPIWLKDQSTLLVNLACIKQCKIHPVCGSMKNLYGLIKNVDKSIFHPILAQTLELIFSEIRCPIAGIADGTYFWIGDFDSGYAVHADLLVLGHRFPIVDKYLEELLREAEIHKIRM